MESKKKLLVFKQFLNLLETLCIQQVSDKYCSPDWELWHFGAKYTRRSAVENYVNLK